VQHFVASSEANYVILPNGKLDFVGKEKTQLAEGQRESLDKLKALIKGLLGRFYIIFVYIVSPVVPRMSWRYGQTFWRRTVLSQIKKGDLIIQIGSGNDRVNDTIVNIDVFDFPEVDIIADCAKLPYKSNSLDGVISSGVLEHVENPTAILREAFRVLKPGGFVITAVPFVMGYHGSPIDNTRWTDQGLEAFHRDIGFQEPQLHVIGGPTSALLWVVQEWLAILLSFGMRPIYYFWYFLLFFPMIPLKIFDLVLIYHPMARRIASSFLCIARKP
jgi:hypothetical protein